MFSESLVIPVCVFSFTTCWVGRGVLGYMEQPGYTVTELTIIGSKSMFYALNDETDQSLICLMVAFRWTFWKRWCDQVLGAEAEKHLVLL